MYVQKATEKSLFTKYECRAFKTLEVSRGQNSNDVTIQNNTADDFKDNPPENAYNTITSAHVPTAATKNMTVTKSTPYKYNIHHSNKTFSYSPAKTHNMIQSNVQEPSFISLKNVKNQNTFQHPDLSRIFFSQTSLRNGISNDFFHKNA